VDAEIPSPSAGVLKEIKVGEGRPCRSKRLVGVIDAAGSAAATPAPASVRKLPRLLRRSRWLVPQPR